MLLVQLHGWSWAAWVKLHSYGAPTQRILTCSWNSIRNVMHVAFLHVELLCCCMVLTSLCLRNQLVKLISQNVHLRQHFVDFITLTTTHENNNSLKTPQCKCYYKHKLHVYCKKKLEKSTGVHSQNKLKVIMMSFTTIYTINFWGNNAYKCICLRQQAATKTGTFSFSY